MQAVEGAVIACAGLGSRLGMGLPKCMIEIDGQTVLSRLLSSLKPRVPRVHVVVGYREELVTEYCARHHRDVVIVRNPLYRETNTAHSLALGSVGFSRKVLYLDGDLLIDDQSLVRFIERANQEDLLIGVTRAKSTQAVFVTPRFDAQGNLQTVQAFHRAPPSPHEWANVFAGSPTLLREGARYVYECLEPALPASVQTLDLFEIDTPEDLAQATAGVRSLSAHS